MVSSAFGGPKPHRPTPAICFPPPPPLPLPKNIPCLRGPDGLLVQFRHKVRTSPANTSNAPTLWHTYTGIANLGYSGSDKYFSASISSATWLNLSVCLTCKQVGPGMRKWYAELDGTLIMPSGRLLHYAHSLTDHNINDFSVPGSYNDIQFDHLTASQVVDNQVASQQTTQWFTVGAPPIF